MLQTPVLLLCFALSAFAASIPEIARREQVKDWIMEEKESDLVYQLEHMPFITAERDQVIVALNDKLKLKKENETLKQLNETYVKPKQLNETDVKKQKNETEMRLQRLVNPEVPEQPMNDIVSFEELMRFLGFVFVPVNKTEMDPAEARFRELMDENSENRQHLVRAKRGAPTKNKASLWAGGYIPFKFSPTSNLQPYREYDGSITDPAAKINEAMRKWEEGTCIKFEEAPFVPENVQHTVISVLDRRPENIYRDSCASILGADTPAFLDLNRYQCIKDEFATIERQLGHILGLYLEQHRPDRDQHVMVLVNETETIANISEKIPKLSDRLVNIDATPYDKDSVMHYPLNSILQSRLGKEQKPTNKTGPSELDKRAINYLYCTFRLKSNVTEQCLSGYNLRLEPCDYYDEYQEFYWNGKKIINSVTGLSLMHEQVWETRVEKEVEKEEELEEVFARVKSAEKVFTLIYPDAAAFTYDNERIRCHNNMYTLGMPMYLDVIGSELVCTATKNPSNHTQWVFDYTKNVKPGL